MDVDPVLVLAAVVGAAAIPSWLHMLARGLPAAPRLDAPGPAPVPGRQAGGRVEPAPAPAVIEPGPSVSAAAHDLPRVLDRAPAPHRQPLGPARKAVTGHRPRELDGGTPRD